MIALTHHLDIGGVTYPVVEAEARLVLSGIGRGEYQVRSEDAPEVGAILRHTIALDGTAWPVLLGVVTEASLLADGLWAVTARELSAALEVTSSLSLRHVTPAQVLTALESSTGLRFLLPAEAPYLLERQPYFMSQGDARAALEQMGVAWGLTQPIWAQLPDGRVYWGAWQDSPFNTDPLVIDPGLIQERDGFDAVELPCLPALRPGMALSIDGATGIINSVTHTGNRTLLTWSAL